MAWNFQTIKYGWRIGIAAVLAGGITIYTAVNVQQRMTQRDAIQVILGTVERCLALQTADGIYPVAPPSIIRSWYSNDYVSTVTNGVTNWTAVLYTNSFTNVIGERLDHAMMVSLDTTLKALPSYYKDPVTLQPLTVTGIFASLNLGDGVSNFTAIPAQGTNAVVFGPWAWRNYIVAWQERYKFLNALQYASNTYMWASNQTIYVWKDVPVVEGLTPRWNSTVYFGSSDHGIDGGPAISWTQITAEATADFGLYTNSSITLYTWASTPASYFATPSTLGPISYTHALWWTNAPGLGWHQIAQALASAGQYELGPFPTNQAHWAIVQARSIAYGDGFTAAGAIGPENTWTNIIDVTNSLSEWEYSATYGGNAMPVWCENPSNSPPGQQGTGNVNEVSYTAQYGPSPSHWALNGTEVTNTAFGSNYVFSYASNKYW